MATHRAIRAIDASTIELLAGDAEAAERELRTGYRMLEEIGDVHLRPMIAAFLAAVLAQEGRSADADELAQFAESHSWEEDIVTQAMWRVARAEIQAAAGQAAEAELLAREAVELAAPTDFPDLQATTLLGLGRVLRQAGSAEAPHAAAEARAVYERKGNIVGARRAALLV
jgi:ATP/maltotriose-dependent transcriptional regulator MalT